MSKLGQGGSLLRQLLAYLVRPNVVPIRRLFGRVPNDREKAEWFGERRIRRILESGRGVELDFKGVELVTQGFFHALLDECMTRDPRWAARISLRNATEGQQAVFELAMRFMVATATDEPPTRVRVPRPLTQAQR
jgi:hypothetical protein